MKMCRDPSMNIQQKCASSINKLYIFEISDPLLLCCCTHFIPKVITKWSCWKIWFTHVNLLFHATVNMQLSHHPHLCCQMHSSFQNICLDSVFLIIFLELVDLDAASTQLSLILSSVYSSSSSSVTHVMTTI